MKAAVASKDGISINLHFGHAKSFYIYEVIDDAITFVEQRDVEQYCHGQHGDVSAMSMILDTIKDCQVCFVAKIGDGPKSKLANINVEAVDDFAYDGIEEGLLNHFGS